LDRETESGERQPKYELYVLEVTDTEITATLSGGQVGDFFVRVFIEGVGNNLNNSNTFSYLIEITNISPTSGSEKGGQIITITGRHFSANIADNQAYVEYSITDTFLGCRIISCTTEEIKCKVPPKTTGIEGVATVAVEGRLLEQAVCSVSGGCLYTYDEALTGSLEDEGTTLQFKNGEVVELAGTLIEGTIYLEVSGVTASAFSKTYTDVEAEIEVLSSTSLSFKVPSDLPQGQYIFMFNQQVNGYIGGFFAQILFEVDQFTTASNIS
jgi:IPT/TIG domain